MEDGTTPAVSGDPTGATPPTAQSPDYLTGGHYVVKVHFDGDDNHNSADETFDLVITATSFDKQLTTVTPYTGTYDGTAHDVVTAADIVSSLGGSDVTDTTKVYVIPRTGSTEMTAPALDASGWKLVCKNGEVEANAVTQTNAGDYEYRVHAYDFLGREASVTAWIPFSIIKAVKPVITKADSKVVKQVENQKKVEKRC